MSEIIEKEERNQEIFEKNDGEINGIDLKKVSPMMQHYLQTKEKYKDCVLFYRLGDFYEMFFDDAITA